MDSDLIHSEGDTTDDPLVTIGTPRQSHSIKPHHSSARGGEGGGGGRGGRGVGGGGMDMEFLLFYIEGSEWKREDCN